MVWATFRNRKRPCAVGALATVSKMPPASRIKGSHLFPCKDIKEVLYCKQMLLLPYNAVPHAYGVRELPIIRMHATAGIQY
jgi:hypothetical protein